MKNILLLPVLLLCAFGAKAQNPAPALPAAAGKTAPLTFEKAYLHTDRDVYAQGDTLWFKAYLVNGQDNKPIASSGTLYVELLAPDSAKILVREIIRLDNGVGNGDMELVDSLPSGKYRLRAYTNWMRNFGDNFVFEKNITILNTQAAPIAPEPKIAAKNKSPKKPAIATTPVTSVIKLPIVRFYPEGGSLVEGISAMVGVKAEDGYGSGIPVKGAVLSSAGDTVARFSCDALGMGLLALLPVKGQSYHALVDPVSGGLSFRHGLVFDLPSALSKGLTLQVKQTDSVIRVVVNAVTGLSDTGKTKAINLVLKHGGKTLLSQQLTLTGAQTAFKIGIAALPEGISAITVYDELGKPACERLVYIYHPGGTNTFIKTDKKNYQPKEKVDVQISAPANSSLSMAVVDADIVPEQAEDIVSALMLQSEIKGNIENARRYFDTTNVNRFKQLDLLLLTQGWRDFVWRRLADTAIRISYAAENGISISGRMWEEVRNKMLPNLNISLYAPTAKGTRIFAATSDSAGRFTIPGVMLYGKQNIKLASVNNKGEKKGTFWVDTIKPMPVIPNPTRITAVQEEDTANSLTQTAMDQRVNTIKKINLKGVTKLKEVNIVQKKKSMILRNGAIVTDWGPTQTFNITPKDYEYRTLEWYLLQNAQGAHQSVPPNGPTGIVFPGTDTTKHSRLVAPMFFINGQELYMGEFIQAEFYRQQYFAMPLNKFKKIELKHMVGTLHGLDANGRLLNPIIETQLLDFYLLYLTLIDDALTDNPGSLNVDIQGYYQARTFYQPVPDAKPSLADYRTTIHWEPNIKTDAMGKANISFYNAVPQTSARIIVQGVSANGSPVATMTDYEIKQ